MNAPNCDAEFDAELGTEFDAYANSVQLTFSMPRTAWKHLIYLLRADDTGPWAAFNASIAAQITQHINDPSPPYADRLTPLHHRHMLGMDFCITPAACQHLADMLRRDPMHHWRAITQPIVAQIAHITRRENGLGLRGHEVKPLPDAPYYVPVLPLPPQPKHSPPGPPLWCAADDCLEADRQARWEADQLSPDDEAGRQPYHDTHDTHDTDE